MRGKVLVVDDQLRARRILVEELRDAGFDVCEAAEGIAGWRAFQEHNPDVVVTDVVMPAADGLALLERIRQNSDVPVILFTAFGSARAATHAFKAGADDFICAEDVEIDDLVDRVAKAIASSQVDTSTPELDREMVGSSPTMKQLRNRIVGIAPLSIPVLICGEPGTGKAMVASLLHRMGPSAPGELCVLTPTRPYLADTQEPAAVLLNRIDEFPQDARAFWAERLEENSKNGFRSSPRIFASTTSRLVDLGDDIEFRAEFNHHLLRFSLELPSLSQIYDDVTEIAQAIAARIGHEVGRRTTLTPSALAFIQNHTWAENMAQLHIAIGRAVTFAVDGKISASTIESVLADQEESVDSMRGRESAKDRDLLVRALTRYGGNISRVAESLGKSRAAVYRMIEKHEVRLRRRKE